LDYPNTTFVRAPLRWAGSKRKSLPTLVGKIPNAFGSYIEPFAGSACLVFAAIETDAVIGDINPDLISFYETLRDNPQQIYDHYSSIRRSPDVYYDSIGHRGRIFCTYALSAWDSPPTSELPSHISEPVVGDLSGWSEDLSKPPCAVIGLGFEPGRALGCIDYLEIPGVRLFVPHGPDVRFEEAVVGANKALFAEVGEGAVLHYDVMNPSDTYQRLESRLFGLAPRSRPVIIPLGPKIFSAVSICLVVQMLPKICVWRTSAGVGENTSDRTAGGEVSCFSINLGLQEFSET